MRGSNSHKKQAWGKCVRKTRRMVPCSARRHTTNNLLYDSRLSKRYCKNFGCFLSREHPSSEHVRAKPIPSTVAGLRGSLSVLGLPTERSGRQLDYCCNNHTKQRELPGVGCVSNLERTNLPHGRSISRLVVLLHDLPSRLITSHSSTI